MAQRREVWNANECTVSIFLEDGFGGFISPSTFPDCYVQDVSAKAVIETSSTGQPGASVKDVDIIPDGYEIRIGSFFFRKSVQLIPFDVRTNRFRILLDFVNPNYTGIAPLEQDPVAFRDAACTDWEITYQDNDTVVMRLAFKAERREAP
jgi:hypothetical protein